MDDGVNWLMFLYILVWRVVFCEMFFVKLVAFGFVIVEVFLVFVFWRFCGKRVLVFLVDIVVFFGICGEDVGGGGVFLIGCNVFDVVVDLLLVV